MDAEELRLRQVEMVVAQIRHRTELRHGYLQRRFVLALTLAGAVFLSLLRSEVPLTASVFAVPPLLWAVWENRRIERLSDEEQKEVTRLLRPLPAAGPVPKRSTPEEETPP